MHYCYLHSLTRSHSDSRSTWEGILIMRISIPIIVTPQSMLQMDGWTSNIYTAITTVLDC